MGELLSYRVRRLFNDRPNPTFVVRDYTRLINWGNSSAPVGTGPFSSVSNQFAAVALASNKLETFRRLENKDGIRTPLYTDSRAVASQWLVESGATVVVRHQLSGHSGAGIELCSGEVDLPLAPLYVQYIKKQKEFRVHVAFGEVIDVQEKRKRIDLPEDFETNYQVRNHQTGWVYCREDLQEPEGLRDMATVTVEALRLDFGAVDLIWNEKRNEVYVLEVNTAPGLEGTTVNKYAEAFVKYIGPKLVEA
jgi:glutathione synthase/RimK-type ligase-like ATP-grasp enzyme